MQDKYMSILEKYLPASSLDYIYPFLKAHKVQLKISRRRLTKTGDYRPPVRHSQHRISVNGDLGKHEFLLTLVHEMAHLEVWEQHRNKARPHGSEWKAVYSRLMEPLLLDGVFPDRLKIELTGYFNRPGTTRASGQELTRILLKFSDEKKGSLLEDLADGSVFITSNGKRYKKLEKMRKRYKCLRMDDKRMYLFSPVALVTPEKSPVF
jgi:SprT protein